MCKEDIRLGKMLSVRGVRKSVVAGDVQMILGSNPNRTRAIVSTLGSSASPVSGSIAGTIDPPTGNVAETITLDVKGAMYVVGYYDGGMFIGVQRATWGSDPPPLTVEVYGQVCTGELWIQSLANGTLTMYATELFYDTRLEDV